MHRLICWEVWRQQQALGRSCRAIVQLEPKEGASTATLQLVEQARFVSVLPSPSQVLGSSLTSAPFALHRRDLQTGEQQKLTLCAPEGDSPGLMAWKHFHCAPP